MKIIANHAHVFQESKRPHGTISVLKQVMDECGISQAVAFAPFPRHFNYDEEPNTNPNRWLYSKIKDDDRLYGFGVIDMNKDNVVEQVQEIYDLGLNGIKMHPAFQHFAVDDKKAYSVYEKAEQLGLPISFHTEYTKLEFEKVTPFCLMKLHSILETLSLPLNMLAAILSSMRL